MKYHFQRKKVMALILALVCVLGLLPTAASAAGDTIKLDGFGASEVAYESAALGSCTLHQMYFDTGDPSMTVGFCGVKGGGMGSSLRGQTWGNPTPITDEYIKIMMAYYYAHTTGTFTAAAHALGEDHVWGSGFTWYMNAWVQAIIWRWKEGLFGDSVVACAEELMAVYNKLDSIITLTGRRQFGIKYVSGQQAPMDKIEAPRYTVRKTGEWMCAPLGRQFSLPHTCCTVSPSFQTRFMI